MYKIFCPKGYLISSLKHLNTEEITYFQTEIQPPQGSHTHTRCLAQKGEKEKNYPHTSLCVWHYTELAKLQWSIFFTIRAKIPKNPHFLDSTGVCHDCFQSLKSQLL